MSTKSEHKSPGFEALGEAGPESESTNRFRTIREDVENLVRQRDELKEACQAALDYHDNIMAEDLPAMLGKLRAALDGLRLPTRHFPWRRKQRKLVLHSERQHGAHLAVAETEKDLTHDATVPN